MVFSANPEDYTNRGNIITPLKDRIASQILTHYPNDVATAKAITDQEAWSERGLTGRGAPARRLQTLVEEIAFVARERPRRPVVRGLGPDADRDPRAPRLEPRAARPSPASGAPRASSTSSRRSRRSPGKIEMVYEGEQQGPEIVASG